MFDVESFEIEEEEVTGGATGVVEAYAHMDLEYPCIIIEPPFEKYRIKVLSSMFSSVGELDELIHLYFKDGERLVAYGSISNRQVDALVSLFKGNTLTGFLSSNQVLEGVKIYCMGVML